MVGQTGQDNSTSLLLTKVPLNINKRVKNRICYEIYLGQVGDIFMTVWRGFTSHHHHPNHLPPLPILQPVPRANFQSLLPHESS